MRDDSMRNAKCEMRNEKFCAIVLASFGSADDKIRATTFDALEVELRKKFPAFEVRQAFTSNFMIRKLARKAIDNAKCAMRNDNGSNYALRITPYELPSDAVARLRRDGFRKIFVLPTHLTPGEEFDNKIKICAAPDVEIIPPLLSEPLDEKIFATILDCFPRADDEDLILIGHGSPNRHNPVYERLQRLAGDRIHIGVIEATDTPNFADVVKRLKISRAEKILLAPLLFNGGVHVAADIAGDGDSWLTRLTALGYKVRVIRDGLGTFEKFRALYVVQLEEKICTSQS